MSIIAYVGLPGSGKSYDVVANQIMPALENNRRVVTNIPLNKDAVREITPKGEIVPLPLEKIAAEPHLVDEYATAGALLVLDEVWRLWPAGLKANNIPQPYKSLLAEHRHRVDAEGRAMQIVLVTQDLAQIAAFARQLVEQTFHHTKLAHLGASSSYRIDVFYGAITGAVPPKQNRIREIFGKYKPEIFKLYQSHTMSEKSGSGADEKKLDGRGEMWKRPSIWLSAVATVGCIIWGSTTIADIVSRKTGGSATSEASSTPPSAPQEKKTEAVRFSQQVVKPMSQSHTAPARPLPRYRLVGTIENHDNPDASVAMITDGDRVAVIDLSHCQTDGGAGGYKCEYDGAQVSVFGSSLN